MCFREDKERNDDGNGWRLTFLPVTRYGTGEQQQILACRRPGKFHIATNSQDLAAFLFPQTKKSGADFSQSGVGSSAGRTTTCSIGHFHCYALGKATSHGLLIAVSDLLP